MPPIWKNNPLYSLGRYYIDLCTRMSYLKLKVVGKEQIPEDGAIILAPNHCNTLMDALVVLQADHGPTLFAVRSDIFRKPGTSPVLRWLKMVPLSRERDGLQEVARNYEVFDEIVDSLDHGMPFCIFSEGTHRAKRSLLPLKKGIFRIALQASAKIDKPVYIVPVGLEYEDYYRYMRPAKVSFGVPINVTEYVRNHPEATESEIFAALSISLHDRISSMITYFPDDERYDAAFAKWEAAHKPVRHWWEWVLAPVLLPFFILFGILCLPMWVCSAILIHRLKDKTWSNTVRFATKGALLPLMMAAFGIPAFCLAPWYVGVTVLLMVIASHSLFFHILNLYTKLLKK